MQPGRSGNRRERRRKIRRDRAGKRAGNARQRDKERPPAERREVRGIGGGWRRETACSRARNQRWAATRPCGPGIRRARPRRRAGRAFAARGEAGLPARMRADRMDPAQQQRLAKLLADHPALRPIYEMKEPLCQLLRLKTQSPGACRNHIRELLDLISTLRESGLEAALTLAKTLSDWTQEIVRMWRFTRNNGITEGFHRKMKLSSKGEPMASDPSPTTACASSLSAVNPNHQPIHPRPSPIFFLDPGFRPLRGGNWRRGRDSNPRYPCGFT